jgi:hypothetical protein
VVTAIPSRLSHQAAGIRQNTGNEAEHNPGKYPHMSPLSMALNTLVFTGPLKIGRRSGNEPRRRISFDYAVLRGRALAQLSVDYIDVYLDLRRVRSSRLFVSEPIAEAAGFLTARLARYAMAHSSLIAVWKSPPCSLHPLLQRLAPTRSLLVTGASPLASLVRASNCGKESASANDTPRGLRYPGH